MVGRVFLVAVAVVVAVSASGCVFDAAVDPGAEIRCNNDGDCPPGTECAGSIDLCVPRDNGDETPPRLVEPALEAARVGGDDEVVASFAASEPLALTPIVAAGVVRLAVTPTNGGARFEARLAASALAEGFHGIAATLVDRGGNDVVELVGVVEVDLSAPHVDGAPELSLAPPPGTAPITPFALVSGGRAEVRFRVDDVRATALSVIARGPTGVALPFALDDQLDRSFRFSRVLDTPAPAGDYEIAVILVDDVGNSAEETLALDPPLVVADIVPGPCAAVHADGSAVCTDVDGDGYDGTQGGCASADDCDDTRATVHPGGIEIAGNLVDDDCDGVDPPLDVVDGVFADPGAPAGGDGSVSAPFRDLADAAAAGAPVIYARAGIFFVELTITGSLIGGLDADWRPTSVERTELAPLAFGNSVLEIVGDAPLRVEAVRVRDGVCSGIYVQPGAGLVEIARSEIRGAGECNDRNGIAAERPIVVSSVDIEIDDAFGYDTTGILASGRVLDTRVFVHTTKAAEAFGVVSANNQANLFVLRGDFDIASSGFGARAIFLPDSGSVVVVGTRVKSVGATEGVGIETADAVIAHTTIDASATASATGAVIFGDGLVIDSQIVATANSESNAIAAFNPVAIYANDLTGSCALRLLNNSTCKSVDEVNACSFAECLGACCNEASGAVALPAMDYGAPSSIAMDSDGDCRGATSIELGADETP